LFKRKTSGVVKMASLALATAFAITGLSGLGAVTLGGAMICREEFAEICQPLQAPGLTLLLLSAGSMVAFLVSIRNSKRFRPW
jgi:hypothetical protein